MLDLDKLIGLDFETYGGTDLPTYGLYNYVSCPTFQPLIAGIAERKVGTIRRQSFPMYDGSNINRLAGLLENRTIVAHNAIFEQLTLRSMGIDLPSDRFIDSAVLARAYGAAGKLEAAAPQVLGIDKVETGKDLIRLFSIPGKYQEESGSLAFDPRIIDAHPMLWEDFHYYCEIDAELGLKLALQLLSWVPDKELDYAAVTMDMNATGWHVDVATVEEMQRRYLENVERTVAEFREKHGAHDLNLNSLKQLKEWCADRGIKAQSFDEKSVGKLITRIEKKIDSAVGAEIFDPKYDGYAEVLDLLHTKQILGGSSLKKLQVILDTTGKDCRLRDQYLHIGAGQTYRTSGRGVQMQNLKRLSDPADMLELQDLEVEWDNDKLAANIRQCFTATHPQGALIVGDFSSVESRGLAWLAGARDKLDAFRNGLDIYKVGAAKQYDVAYDDVSKEQRQFGKVGELSCGYGAGGSAVQAFAENMGVLLTEGEATRLVSDWRTANPQIVELWDELDEALNLALDSRSPYAIRVGPQKEYRLVVGPVATPASLREQHATAQSLSVTLYNSLHRMVLTRVFHGCYRRGRNICYYKPSELKSGDLWRDRYTDQKTKQVRHYSIYGGKLAGILTQSFCRELFFEVLTDVHDWVGRTPGLELVGQFHDEIVLDWSPACATSLEGAKQMLESSMSSTTVPGFPLAAEIKHDYRYTK